MKVWYVTQDNYLRREDITQLTELLAQRFQNPVVEVKKYVEAEVSPGKADWVVLDVAYREGMNGLLLCLRHANPHAQFLFLADDSSQELSDYVWRIPELLGKGQSLVIPEGEDRATYVGHVFSQYVEQFAHRVPLRMA